MPSVKYSKRLINGDDDNVDSLIYLFVFPHYSPQRRYGNFNSI